MISINPSNKSFYIDFASSWLMLVITTLGRAVEEGINLEGDAKWLGEIDGGIAGWCFRGCLEGPASKMIFSLHMSFSKDVLVLEALQTH